YRVHAAARRRVHTFGEVTDVALRTGRRRSAGARRGVRVPVGPVGPARRPVARADRPAAAPSVRRAPHPAALARLVELSGGPGAGAVGLAGRAPVGRPYTDRPAPVAGPAREGRPAAAAALRPADPVDGRARARGGRGGVGHAEVGERRAGPAAQRTGRTGRWVLPERRRRRRGAGRGPGRPHRHGAGGGPTR